MSFVLEPGERRLPAAGPNAVPSHGPFIVRRVVVAGADTPVGRAAAELFAERGADVGLLYTHDAEQALLAARAIHARGGRVVVSRLDPNEVHSIRDQVEDVVDELGGVDVLVVDGRTDKGGSVLTIEPDDWRAVISVELDAMFFAIQLCARRMVRDGRGGRIVAVTWLPDHRSLEGSAALEAAEDGLSGIVRRSALELAPHRITVNAVSPGDIAAAGEHRSEEQAHIPLGFAGDPRDVADAIAFLASDSARYVTGASIAVDGGMLLTGPTASRVGQTRP